MKKYIRSYLITVASLLISANLIESISFSQGEKTLFLTAFALTFFNLIAKPVINLLLLPVNLLTLGLFRWLVNVFGFYLIFLIIPQFTISPYLFPGFVKDGFIVPSIQLSLFWTLILTSFIISLVSSILYWVFKK